MNSYLLAVSGISSSRSYQAKMSSRAADADNFRSRLPAEGLRLEGLLEADLSLFPPP